MAFSIAWIILLGLSADYLFKRFHIPGLVGMLLAGVLTGPYVLGLMSAEMMAVSGDFRKIALVVILLRAGFELRRDALHRVGRAAVIMSCLPAVFEIGGVMLTAPHLLGFSLLDSAVLGTILAAVSPAVVVPLMIDFIEKGRGTRKGIPTLILGASSLDDVFVIVLFTVILGIATGSQTNIGLQLAQIPISVVLGILLGLLPGYFLVRLFTRFSWKPPKRTLVVLGAAILLTWIEDSLSDHIAVASLLGVMAIGFIILEKSEAVAHLISRKLKTLWIFAEMILFVLVGAQVNIHVAWKAGLAGSAVIFTGLLFRSIGTYLSLAKSGLNPPEKLFCTVAYIPKATVQAAIGAVPMAAGLASGEMILAVAVLSIVLTAPLGAIGIAYLGERILDREEKSAYRFKSIRNRLELPRVGERILHRASGVVWKVIEEREIWLTGNDKTSSLAPAGQTLQPVIYQRYWRDQTDGKAGTGRTQEHYYYYTDQPFQTMWEVLYDW
ncbi:MAG: sodium:proton antiporter [Desulfobacteraceae bacterium]|nr:sodium:proton antiporter [Desulfobacteraceae bacterium]